MTSGTDNQQVKERQVKTFAALQTLKDKQKGAKEKAVELVENRRQALTDDLPTDLVDSHTKFATLLNKPVNEGGADAQLTLTGNENDNKEL